MINHEFNTVNVSDGSTVEVYTAFPVSDQKSPAIILIQEAFGVTGHIRSVAERLCKEGYAVASPDIFHRTVHRLEASYEDFPSIMPHYQALTKENLIADLKAVFEFLQNNKNVNSEKIGCIGFCLGGRVAFLANTALPISAAVSYYGGGLDLLADEAKNMNCAHLFFWAGLDSNITIDKVDTIINAVKKAGKEYTSVTFSKANHAFNNDERPVFNPTASKEAWAHTLAFFENRLK